MTTGMYKHTKTLGHLEGGGGERGSLEGKLLK